MRAFPAELIANYHRVHKVGVDCWFVTFDIPGGPTHRLVDYRTSLTLNGYVHTGFNFQVGTIRHAHGELPDVQLGFSNLGLFLQDDIKQYDGLRGSTLTLVRANTELLEIDHTAQTQAFHVLRVTNNLNDVVAHLGAPAAITKNSPSRTYDQSGCGHRFGDAWCGYTAPAIESLTLPSGSPVSLTQTGHGYETGVKIQLTVMVGITPDLSGQSFTITVVDDDTFTLDDTDGADYSGTFVSGKAGYLYCPGHYAACKARGMEANAGFEIGARNDTVRYVVSNT